MATAGESDEAGINDPPDSVEEARRLAEDMKQKARLLERWADRKENQR